MKEPWELCKKLNNPERLALLRSVYRTEDGLNAGLAIESARLGQSGTSQYLKQLEDLGLIRRERAGRFVNYLPDLRNANIRIRPIGELLKTRLTAKGGADLTFTRHFPALMNARRARIVAALAACGELSGDEICDRFNIISKHLTREMKPIVDCGLASVAADIYRYIKPNDSISQEVIAQTVI